MNKFSIYRHKAGHTQEYVAESLDTDRSTVAKWETGKSKPRSDLLPKIAALYKCTIDDLLTEPDPSKG